jgi:phage major head subunit gpT-like protein
LKVITATSLQALRTGFSTLFNAGAGSAPNVSSPFVTEVKSTTKVETYGFLSAMPLFRKWIGEKRWKTLEEKAYQLVNDAFEASLGIHKHQIQDDNLGLYGPIFQGWGEDAGSLKDRLAFDALAKGHELPCFDGQNFFDTDHPVMVLNEDGTLVAGTASNMGGDNSTEAWFLLVCNRPLKPVLYQNRESPHFHMVTSMEDSHVLSTGEFLASGEARGAAGFTYWQLAYRCTGPVNAENYKAGKLALQSLTDDEGQPLGNRPTHGVFGISTQQAAKDLFGKANLAGGESNTLFGEITIIEADRLP